MTTNNPRIPLMRPLLPTADQLLPYLRQIDESRWYSNFGPMVDAFETRLAAMLGLTKDNLVCVTSGTIGLVLSLRAQEPAPDSYCLMPSWTFVASANAVRWAQMRPWFLDVEEATWMLTPERARAALDDVDGPIGAVMPVSAFGAPVDVAGWDAFRAETGIPVIIDAAAAFDGAQFGEAPLVISLHATKVLGIGEGAFIASRDLEFAARVRSLSNFGFVSRQESELEGINAKVSEYAAAVGMAALDRWSLVRAAFSRATQHYQEAFADMPRVSLAPGLSETHVRSTLSMRLADPCADRMMSDLAAAGIASRQWWGKGCHIMGAFKTMPRAPLPVTEMLARSVVGLPFSQDIRVDEICDVRDAVERALSR